MIQGNSSSVQPEPTGHSNENPVRIVAIGASAGGLEALELFFDQFPDGSDLAFVVIMHLSPDYKSLMVEIISRRTKMVVQEAQDGINLTPNTVYIIPPKKNLTVHNGKLFLNEQEKGLNLPIDIFFRSLADDQKENSIGIVLSGTGSDGSRGIRTIKEVGGMVMVQDVETAKFDGMPRSAIATGIVDYILPPEMMPEKLLHFVNGALGSDYEGDSPLTRENDLFRILGRIRSRMGVDFSFYKSSTVMRRIERRLGITQTGNVERYIEYLEENPQEITILFKELLIGVTKFFRDTEVFDMVKEKVLPEIFNTINTGEEIRAWVAGCSTGEEAYSMAILMTEFLEENGLYNEIKIFATDIDKDALQYAGYGIYPESIAADASRERLGKYFIKKGEHYQVAPSIRKKVVFAYHNIIKDPPFRNMHLISCRNLLIYLQPVLQKRVLSNFAFSLNAGGILVLGTSETIGEFNDLFLTYSQKWKIYRTQQGRKHKGSFFVQPVAYKPEPSHPVMQRPVNGKKQTVIDTIYKSVLEQLMPPSVLIDKDRQVVYIFGDVDAYLKLPSGKIETNIARLARRSIAVQLGAALQKCMNEGINVTYENLKVTDSTGKSRGADITVRPFSAGEEQYFIILFQEVSEGTQVSGCPEPRDVDQDMLERITDLENELQMARQSLQSTIEELETSNEELQATNEELMASNEELQSTNEELQSVNEELITVNSEYQNKISELTGLNEDMNNLLANTDIGTLFLDERLHIRKFTPATTELVNIIETDVGRPISHLSHQLEYDDFVEDIRDVLATKQAVEKRIRAEKGQWLLVRIRPFFSAGGKVTGVVVSFVDISRQIAAEDRQERNHDLLIRFLKASPAANMIVDRQGQVIFANETAESLLGLSSSTLQRVGHSFDRLELKTPGDEELDEQENLFAVILRTKKAHTEKVRCYSLPGGGVLDFSLTGIPVFDNDGEVDGAVFSFQEIAHAPHCSMKSGKNAPLS
ncbi:MAG: chemotaxis protein CheB [Desulfovibrionales bacterium]